ncbi:hypothetical protein BESB_052080 [Besnoitia besnoiti]|uniref:Uncharacterized protein n=1 Tax=Besnoitia besnoiti TaxID=94643 RepID=A0A2A9MIY6_BESBE|nr:hypothetical protein BESB_052080 [Besnoitia besnoiti]PFH35557.1 hypothetical protein BESB_052080 [Besnoitia besnoiti]
MHSLRRGVSVPSRLLPRRDSWLSLAPFAGQNNAAAWRKLRDGAQEVQTVIDRHVTTKTQPIDWTKWESQIAHKDILQCLKSFYTSQMQILDQTAGALKKAGNPAACEVAAKGWALYDNALQACAKSVEKSEELLANGARALWVSCNNPPVWKVDTNEWLDSDQYWQAFVEKHHFYSQYQPGVADPEATQEVEAFKHSWHSRMSKFNDRSDTPMLYAYMDELPSWEYYDLHRSAFLEHMTYYLVRTGGDFRFFPEMPPWQWLAHIENLRYKLLSVAQSRRAHLQLTNLERERALDFLPVDVEHHGEEYTQKFLQTETEMFQACAARLMGNYMFLCDPFIPVQSVEALEEVAKVAGGKGSLFSLGDDVNALFFLPDQEKREVARPTEAVQTLMNHLKKTDRSFNPSYTALLGIHAEVLEERGEHWLAAPGECVSQAFLRRLRTDDPAYEVYCSYFTEMYERFASAKEVSLADGRKLLKDIHAKAQEEERAYAIALQSMGSTELAQRAREGAEKLKALQAAQEQLQGKAGQA